MKLQPLQNFWVNLPSQSKCSLWGATTLLLAMFMSIGIFYLSPPSTKHNAMTNHWREQANHYFHKKGRALPGTNLTKTSPEEMILLAAGVLETPTIGEDYRQKK